MHNAMSTKEDNFILPNHILTMEKALAAGYRAFMLDVCDCGRLDLQFCHGVCFAGTREIIDVFQNLINFLNKNSNEVVILEFQMGTSSLDMLNNLFDRMASVDGFVDMMYVHKDKIADWPVMNEIIDKNKRIIAFQHNGPSCKNEYLIGCPSQIHYWWDYTIATRFDFASVDDILDFPKSCLIHYGKGGSKSFFNLNHFITDLIPNQSAAVAINTEEVIKTRVSVCSELNDGISLNFLTVDFWNSGNILNVVDGYNEAQSKLLR
eukprot:CAMPEP_0194395364 /NCGR_PEP_ID=MMETSP0174-20130528/124381_1 /TAXON_ID=216777 /ORGANISM="Proboscia alata, Strain PI-D3" /LENGTH=263 /DNA_ID=CAMNT_0039191289 /DNA_START=501 /DNA_END=1292 /DNA_ORIENTATION=-